MDTEILVDETEIVSEVWLFAESSVEGSDGFFWSSMQFCGRVAKGSWLELVINIKLSMALETFLKWCSHVCNVCTWVGLRKVSWFW